MTAIGETFLDVADYLREQHLAPDWSALTLLRRI